MRLRFYFHVTLWSALIIAFLAFGVSAIAPSISDKEIGPVDPNHSTDSYLSSLTHVRNGTALFSDLISTLPRDKTVVIFVWDQNWSSEFLGMLMAYLSWPLDVRIVKVRPETIEREASTAGSNSVAGFLFCSINPPTSMIGAVHFGSAIVFVPNPTESRQ